MDPRESRTFIKVHDGMPDHPKIDGLSDAAFRLLVETWCWCSRHLTDGHVPAATWKKRGTPKARKELTDAGLVEILPGGDIQVHDYLEHQRSKAQVEELSRKRREAGSRGGLSKAAKSLASATASATPLAKQEAKQNASKRAASAKQKPAREQSISDEQSSSDADAAAPTAQKLVAEWIDLCGGVTPDRRFLGEASKEMKRLLVEEGIPYDQVSAGLRIWHERGLAVGALKSCVHGVRVHGEQGRASQRRADTPDASWDAYRQAVAAAQTERTSA